MDFTNTCTRTLLNPNKSITDIQETIIEFAKTSTQSSNYTVFQLDHETNEFLSTLSDLKDENGKDIQLRISKNKGIPGHVLRTAQLVSVKDAYADPNFSRDTDVLTKYTTKTILASPLFDDGRCFGVMQFLNKSHGVYTKEDEEVMQLCTNFYNLTTHIIQVKKEKKRMSNEILILKELLEYHTKSRKKDLRKITAPSATVSVPDDFYKFSFDYYKNSSQFGLWFLNIAKDVMDKCEVRYCKKALIRFTATVKRHYRDLPYHTWDHAFSVAHFMYLLLEKVFDKFPVIEKVALIFACICHDLDHRARNNAFMQNTDHPISRLYGESLMENHHFYMCKYIFQRKECQFLLGLDEEQEKEFFAVMKSAIIATDLLKSFKYRDDLKEIVDSKSFVWESVEHRSLATCIMMTVSDLCASCKPWEIHKFSSTKVFKEFYDQADEEVSLGMTPLAMFMNKDEIALNQIGFLNGIVKPCVQVLVPVIPAMVEIEEQIQCSSNRWEEKVKTEKNTEDLESLVTPGNTLQENSISFVRYNCSGDTSQQRSKK
ncbi:cAMP and cAMP-inhibited cGMP 3',5'-cyclic phosphodiesterase 10A-like [Hydractinia symbiolongicarpus]|uniref:cAMP and cAMP-inhibited cGMP 3',5'-cyclic phosphodiesterase 10A-like n=1 Tax=Hydractinia symbiolongicarpus TaxID=13093 RepID=UPI00254DDB25|nr:cAMP and cAMP-inhibited cGMP 3',5'-cyclic phosphodiesterase 10A-like [Hydractinia symbiolongicarpus]